MSVLRREASSDVLLRTRRLLMKFGSLRVLNGVSVDVRRGEILGVIGPNGSGKSTWMNCITGLYRPIAGSVIFNGEDITGRPPHVSYHRGIARTFQLLENFATLSVRDNLVLSGQERHGSILSRALRRTRSHEHHQASAMANFLGLRDVLDDTVNTLSYGQQKLVDIGMALMSEPKVLLLDEPMSGVNPSLITQIVSRLRELNEGGMTLIVIEHNMKMMMQFCERLVVLDHGELIADDVPEVVRRNPEVISAYFGR